MGHPVPESPQKGRPKMKIIKVEVLAVRQTEQVSANLHVEKQKGTMWNRTRVISVVSGQPDALREFLLEDDERLIIEGASRKIVEYDRNQSATKIVDADPEVREAQNRADSATHEANALRERKEREVKPPLAEAERQAQPRTNLGNLTGRPIGAAGVIPRPTLPTVPMKESNE